LKQFPPFPSSAKYQKQKLNQILFVDGTKIKILIRCDFRKEGARITGIVEDIDIQFTQGELALQKLAIIQELKKQVDELKQELEALKK
jgi:hypothetical protein